MPMPMPMPMAFFSSSKVFLLLLLVSLIAGGAHAQLYANFYARRCPNLERIVRSVMAQAVASDPRMGASILRLHYHDCFVNGCDGSVLLDDTPTFAGEKGAPPNRNSLRGYAVIDAIKAQVEASCRATVSCADILALAARDGVVLLGGRTWPVKLGRRDSRTASQAAAVANLPSPSSSLPQLISIFARKGLSARDMTVLSGAHTIGFARCSTFRSHVHSDRDINSTFAALRQRTCPAAGGDGNVASLDVQSPLRFDTGYFQNLVERKGLLHSDQVLFDGGSQDNLVRIYSRNSAIFAADFAGAMEKMGDIIPLTGRSGEIRLNCRRTN